MTFDVACVGIAVYDVVFELDSLPVTAGKQPRECSNSPADRRR